MNVLDGGGRVRNVVNCVVKVYRWQIFPRAARECGGGSSMVFRSAYLICIGIGILWQNIWHWWSVLSTCRYFVAEVLAFSMIKINKSNIFKSKVCSIFPRQFNDTKIRNNQICFHFLHQPRLSTTTRGLIPRKKICCKTLLNEVSITQKT